MKPLVTLSWNFCSDGVNRSVFSTFLLGLGFESSNFSDVTKQLFSQRAREKTKCQDYHGKMRRWGDNGFFLFFCWSWVRVFCGFRPGPLKIRRPMMRLAAFRKLIASSSRRFGVGGRGEISLFGRGDDFFLSAPSHCFFFAQCTPKYNLQAPHAIVACITPVLAKCILLLSCHLSRLYCL